MAIGYNLTYYNGKKIRDYDPAAGITDPTGVTWRIRMRYDDESGMDLAGKVQHFADQELAGQVPAIVFGNYGEYDTSPAKAIEVLVANKEKLSGLRNIFMGDISYEESEMSWIQNCSMTPLLHAFPQLEIFGVRGANGLGFAGLSHDNLKKLVVQTGGMSMGQVNEILAATLPALEHLELWLGSDNYGWDGDAESLRVMHELPQFPHLKYLGFVNSEIADEIAASLGNAPVLSRIETLSLHNGNISDEGAKALVANPPPWKSENAGPASQLHLLRLPGGNEETFQGAQGKTGPEKE
jgi:hypothetical protein